jgi:hypothetical protein
MAILIGWAQRNAFVTSLSTNLIEGGVAILDHAFDTTILLENDLEQDRN